MKKIYNFSQFNSYPLGHGGEKRTSQIFDLIQSNFGSIFKYNPGTKADYSKIKALFNSIHLLKPKDFLQIDSLHSLKKYAHYLYKQYKVNKYSETTFKPGDILLWENTMSSYGYIPKLIKKLSIPIVALPHNLESLVSGQLYNFTKIKSPDWFKYELKYLKECDEVFTISQEEQWLLNVFGINAHYLPYYPIQIVEDQLKIIKEKRSQQFNIIKDKILLLGTASNPPTFSGMLDRIKLFSKAFPNRFLDVVGYRTETLAPYITNKNIRLHGGVSNPYLHDLLLNTKVVIIHQNASSGALTKIPELLIAGIPILSNTFAARNYHKISGVYEYYCDSSFISMIENDTFQSPQSFSKEVIHENYFIDTITNLILPK